MPTITLPPKEELTEDVLDLISEKLKEIQLQDLEDETEIDLKPDETVAWGISYHT